MDNSEASYRHHTATLLTQKDGKGEGKRAKFCVYDDVGLNMMVI